MSEYNVPALLICSADNIQCTFHNVHAAVMATQVPGYDGPTSDEKIYPVTLPNGLYIGDVEVWDNGTDVINETQSNHWMYYGYVDRVIDPTGVGIYLSTNGAGWNVYGLAMATANQFKGPELFAQQQLTTQRYFCQHFGGC